MILFTGPHYFLKCCHWIAGKDSGQRVMHTLPYLIKLVRGFCIHNHKCSSKWHQSDGKLVCASAWQQDNTDIMKALITLNLTKPFDHCGYHNNIFRHLKLFDISGSYSVEVNTWRPIGNGPGPEMRRFFIGGSPELEDPTYPQKPAMADVRSIVLSFHWFVVHFWLFCY